MRVSPAIFPCPDQQVVHIYYVNLCHFIFMHQNEFEWPILSPGYPFGCPELNKVHFRVTISYFCWNFPFARTPHIEFYQNVCIPCHHVMAFIKASAQSDYVRQFLFMYRNVCKHVNLVLFYPTMRIFCLTDVFAQWCFELTRLLSWDLLTCRHFCQ